MKKIFYAGIILLTCGLFHQGCATLTAGGSGSSRLKSDILTGPQRVQAEQSQSVQFDQELVKKQALLNDPATVQMLSNMVNKITRASHRPNSRFVVRLVNDKTPNAFSIGGEYIYVHKGLLDFTGANKDALAGVLAHEVSHDIAGHSSRGMAAQNWQALATEVVARATKSKVATAVTQAAGTLVYLKYTRSQEQEADILGTVYATRAGYNSDAFITFFQELEKQAGGIPANLAFLSSHPSYDTRVQTIHLVQKYLKQQMTIPQINAVDPKAADVLQTIAELDGTPAAG